MRVTDEELEAALDELYTRPLAEFTGRRNELGQGLRDAGRADAARSVKSLGKPSVSAWAVNQLWHGERPAFEALLDAGEAVREATRAGSFGDAHRDAMQRRRAAIDALLVLARAHLEAAGHAASMGTMRRVQGTLEAVAGHGRALPRPGPGRLQRDLEPTGFDALAAFGLPPAGAPRDGGGPHPRVDDEVTQRRREERARLQEKLDPARRALARAEAEETAAEDRAEKARAIAARARDDRAAAAETLRVLEDRIARLESQLEDT